MNERPPRQATATQALLAISLLFVAGLVIGFILGRTI